MLGDNIWTFIRQSSRQVVKLALAVIFLSQLPKVSDNPVTVGYKTHFLLTAKQNH